MLSEVNVTLLRQFLGFYCLSKLIILFNLDVFFISLLFRILQSLIHIQLPLVHLELGKWYIVKTGSRLLYLSKLIIFFMFSSCQYYLGLFLA